MQDTAGRVKRMLRAYHPSDVGALPGLRQRRRRMAYSQRDLAERSGVAASTIWRIENAKSQADHATTRKLAEALDCKPVDLMPPDDEV